MDLKEIHDHILLRANKDQSGYFTHDEIDQALDYAQMAYFNRLFGSPATYQPGRHVATPGYGTTQKIHDDLSPFKTVIKYNNEKITATNARGTSPGGVAVMPTNYLHMVAMYIGTAAYTLIDTYPFTAGTDTINTDFIEGRVIKLVLFNDDGATAFDGNIAIDYGSTTIADDPNTDVIFLVPTTAQNLVTTSDQDGVIKAYELSHPTSWTAVEFLSEDQWANRVSSKLLTPSATEPIAKVLQRGGYVESTDGNGDAVALTYSNQTQIQLWPRQGYNLECVYLRRPAAPNYVFTTSGRAEVYNAGSSTQMEWNDQALTVIIELALNILAQNIQDQELERHTEVKNQQPR